MKRELSHICANVIVYRAADPRHLFVTVKDGTYPILLWRGCLALLGGNWLGEDAADDLSPHDTLNREVREELSLDRSVQQSTAGVGDFFSLAAPVEYHTAILGRQPTTQDEGAIAALAAKIVFSGVHLVDYIQTTTREAFAEADPMSTQGDMTSLLSIFTSGLDEATWASLKMLHEAFGNLSLESESRILTVDEIIDQSLFGTGGMDHALRYFFDREGVVDGQALPVKPTTRVEFVPLAFSTYDHYVKHYEVRRRPPGR